MDVRVHDDPATFDAATRDCTRPTPCGTRSPSRSSPDFLTTRRSRPSCSPCTATASCTARVPHPALAGDHQRAPGRRGARRRRGPGRIDPHVPGVTGPREPAEAFARRGPTTPGRCARRWRAGSTSSATCSSRPCPAPAASPTEDDVPLLACWRNAFQLEALGHERDAERAEEIDPALAGPRRPPPALGGRRRGRRPGRTPARRRRHVPRRPRLHPAGVARPRLRLGRHRRGLPLGPRRRRAARAAVHRPGQPDVELDLPEASATAPCSTPARSSSRPRRDRLLPWNP